MSYQRDRMNLHAADRQRRRQNNKINNIKESFDDSLEQQEKRIHDLEQIIIPKVIINKSKHFVYKDSMHVKMYECQNCEYTHVIDNDKYCSNCGSKIEWIE